MNLDRPVDFVNGQSFLLTNPKMPKLIANFAPVDSQLYFDPAKGPDASPIMARIKIKNQNYIREAWLDLTRTELARQITDQISTCRIATAPHYLEQPHKISTITGTSKPVTTVRRSNGSKRLV